MKWYWVVPGENAVLDPLVLDSGDLIGLDEAELLLGKKITNWKVPLLRTAKEENDGDPDDALQNHLGLPIFSARAREALSSLGTGGIQYLPVRVARPSGVEISGFAVANVIERRSALVNERSKYEVFPEDFPVPSKRGQIRALELPTLNRSALEDCDVFRLLEYPFALFVSERFKRLFEGNSLTGLGFHEVPAEFYAGEAQVVN